MSQPDPESPNGMWERFGHRVERYSIAPGAAQLLRRIYEPSGELVMDAAGYDAELAYCRALDIYTLTSHIPGAPTHGTRN